MSHKHLAVPTPGLGIPLPYIVGVISRSVSTMADFIIFSFHDLSFVIYDSQKSFITRQIILMVSQIYYCLMRGEKLVVK